MRQASDSGSFESFTEVVVGTAKSSRTDVSTAEDHDVLAQRIAADKDALGYISLDYYVENQNRLKAVAISDGKEAVLPTVGQHPQRQLSAPVASALPLRQRKIARKARRQGLRRFLHEECSQAGRRSELPAAANQGV
jgi:ABC-type phosphate transport system substrate-binding protein